MVGSRIWNGSVGLEGMGGYREIAGEIFKMGIGSIMENAGLYGEGRATKGIVEGEGEDKSLGIRGEIGEGRRK